MSDCTNGELRDLLPELLNGQLDEEMTREVEAHIASCEECTAELALLRSLRPALMRGPIVDARKIAAAVHAQTSAQPPRDATRPRISTPVRVAIAAAALFAVSAIGYAVVRRGGAAEEVAVVHGGDTIPRAAVHETVTALAPAPIPVVVTPRSAPVHEPPQQVAVAPPHGAAPISAATTSDGVLDNLSDLSDDDVRTLTASLDGLSSVPDADPSAGIDPLGATLDDNSGGGS
jgi:anti-sigma factor RsiW